MQALFAALGLSVLERGWLSSNNVVFRAGRRAPAAIVDTGHARHAEQTRALVQHALGEPPALIVNTHLHSDHCGGNALLQATWPLRTRVPAASFDAVRQWDLERLTYRAADQCCDRFTADAAIAPGDRIALGEALWQVLAAPGHDPEAVMLFEPETRVLISGDALWEDRLAIVFPELAGMAGFGPTADTLKAIEDLRPAAVIPGHGAPFDDVAAALETSRRRLTGFVQDPSRHARYASRALAMYRVMERPASGRAALAEAMAAAPVMRHVIAGSGMASPRAWADAVIDGLLEDALIRIDGEGLVQAA